MAGYCPEAPELTPIGGHRRYASSINPGQETKRNSAIIVTWPRTACLICLQGLFACCGIDMPALLHNSSKETFIDLDFVSFPGCGIHAGHTPPALVSVYCTASVTRLIHKLAVEKVSALQPCKMATLTLHKSDALSDTVHLLNAIMHLAVYAPHQLSRSWPNPNLLR